MKTWRIPVTWEMCGVITCEVSTLEDAMRYAEDIDGTIPLPCDKEYVDGGWCLTHDMDEKEIVRDFWNDNQKDECR